MTDYTATVTRDEELWVVTIDGLPRNAPGVADYVYFSEIRDEVPEFIADHTGTDPEDFTVTWRYEFGGEDVTGEVLAFLTTEERLRKARSVHASSRTRVLEAMRGAGLSQRAMADVVSLSRQRVQQLLDGDQAPAPRERPTVPEPF